MEQPKPPQVVQGRPVYNPYPNRAQVKSPASAAAAAAGYGASSAESVHSANALSLAEVTAALTSDGASSAELPPIPRKHNSHGGLSLAEVAAAFGTDGASSAELPPIPHDGTTKPPSHSTSRGDGGNVVCSGGTKTTHNAIKSTVRERDRGRGDAPAAAVVSSSSAVKRDTAYIETDDSHLTIDSGALGSAELTDDYITPMQAQRQRTARESMLKSLMFRRESMSNELVRTPSNRHDELVRIVSSSSIELPRSRLTKVSVAGKGSFGTVYRGALRGEDGVDLPVAIKELHADASEKSHIHFLQVCCCSPVASFLWLFLVGLLLFRRLYFFFFSLATCLSRMPLLRCPFLTSCRA